MSDPTTIPDPAVVVLVGPAGSGKSTWAAAHYRASEIISSDALRGIVGSGDHDLAASADAFMVLEQIVAARLNRGLNTVIDTLGLQPERRRGYLSQARSAGLPAVAVVLDTAASLCRSRNSQRDQPVPARVLQAQLAGLNVAREQIPGEGWDVVVTARSATPVAGGAPDARATVIEPTRPPGSLKVILQISRFPWSDDPAGWLRAVAGAAEDTGFHGIALMDHLIQIPQVGRSWDPIPEPWVTLGLLAGSTTRLQLGTLVSPVTFRAPGLLAKVVATLDVLSGGRAFCGIGAGWWDREHAAFGLAFPPAAERLDQLEAAIEMMRALWAPGTKAHHGELVDLPETTCYPRPVSRIPIIVGGGGERRTLRIAARHADGCNVPSDLDTLDRKVRVLRQHCLDAGRDPGEVAVTVLDIPIIGTDRDEVAAKVERLRGRVSAPVFAHRHHAATLDGQIERYRQLAERGVDTVFLALPDLAGPRDVRSLAPLVAAVRLDRT